MIQLTQVKLLIPHTREELIKKVCTLLKIELHQLKQLEIIKQSLDARKKPTLYNSYTIIVGLEDASEEERILKRNPKQNITKYKPIMYTFPKTNNGKMLQSPVIVGSGPAGLFCAYELAKHGYQPILLERGNCVRQRLKDVEEFWETRALNLSSNVQFGEGGAGTFSDGKLNTLVKDKYGRNKEVLELFVRFGAPKEILYENKPHIGTDLLITIVEKMREEIIRFGGIVRFATTVTNLRLEETSNGYQIEGVEINGEEILSTNQVILAIGHSARDTFTMLQEHHIPMEAKSFAVGFRVEHPQALINRSQYATEQMEFLPTAAYKLVANPYGERGIYSFCMCPGGYVVNASSQEKRLAINGMSYHKRDSQNANSAIIVGVTPKDFPSNHPLAGVAFQIALEEKAYALCKGRIPIQRLEDFIENRSSHIEDFTYLPCMKGGYEPSNLRMLLSEECNKAFLNGMEQFHRKIKGFADPNTIVSGIESRTSSPVRILRDDTLQSTVRGLYPCGEGAGYAGGIMSAAMDGMKVAEEIARQS
ncbi:MAG: FAD-dependent oxidoreductase [Eubacteriales bacterium]